MDWFTGILEALLSQPLLFFFLLFIYSVLVAIILPIPIEIALVFAIGDIPFLIGVAITIGLGKTVGAMGIFYLGLKVEDNIRRWSSKYKWIDNFVKAMIKFVDKTGYWGFFILLSIPFMLDTVPIYIYSLFNEEGRLMSRNYFLFTNFVAGIVRSVLFLILWNVGIHLV
ncbi:MAG: hypothetical protein JSV43_08395 [Methanobacteriota archaeon]|nr:MAG: hypothetical protein JSV43_08395 [Euryarchaeota archaeon]